MKSSRIQLIFVQKSDTVQDFSRQQYAAEPELVLRHHQWNGWGSNP